MKTVALIPIKLGSKRVPGKNIKPFFDGTPLMHFIQKACLEAKNIDEVYIYCSDDAVKDYILCKRTYYISVCKGVDYRGLCCKSC